MEKWAENWRKSNKKGTIKRTEDFEITKKSTDQINTFVLAVKSCFPVSKKWFEIHYNQLSYHNHNFHVKYKYISGNSSAT